MKRLLLIMMLNLAFQLAKKDGIETKTEKYVYSFDNRDGLYYILDCENGEIRGTPKKRNIVKVAYELIEQDIEAAKLREYYKKEREETEI